MFLKPLSVKIFGVIVAAAALVGTAASAQQITETQVRQFISVGNFRDLDAALDLQKEAVNRGTVTQDQQRETYISFSRSDPKMHGFVRNWVKDMPNSLYALTAQVWVNYNIAWFVRGDEAAHQTYPDAMNVFSRLMGDALHLALKANALDNGFVPASDAILRLGLQKTLPRPVEDYLAEIMEISPNYGSLLRGFSSTHPGWGGRWSDVEQMCNTYAALVPDFEGYTSRICKLDAAITAKHHHNIQSGYIETLEDFEHPAIKDYRLYAALFLFSNVKIVDELARAQVMESEFTNVSRAVEYDRFIAAQHGWPAQALNVYARAIKEAEDRLPTDPHNPELLKTLALETVNGTAVPNQPSYEERIDLLKRSLVFQPYNKVIWNEWFTMQFAHWVPDAPLAAEATLNNAVVYSNHDPHRVKDAMDYYFNLADFQGKLYDKAEEMPKIEKQRFLASQFMEMSQVEFICPFIRAHRVWKEVCAYSTENMQCYPREAEVSGYQSLLTHTQANDMCLKERTSPIQEMFYTPVPVDLGYSQG
ncbi:hypothetical protein N9M66_05950 [Litoreibacter sp.]|nr:hypothetical protein [Litoreibacter sp.]